MEKVSALATSVFWLVLPSLVLFVALPLLLRQGLNFSLGLAAGLAAACYGLMMVALTHYGIKL